MAEAVFDASAALAVVLREPGAEAVLRHLPRALISAVNAAEMLPRLVGMGLRVEDAARCLDGLDLDTVPFEAEDAAVVASLRAATRSLGLSLADRVCLGLGLVRGLPVLTADRVWAGLDVGVRVELIR